MKSTLSHIALWMLLILVAGCSGNGKKIAANDETLSSGTIHISVDESFKPVIDSQLRVFLDKYPNAHIITHYKPEAECLKDLLNDSIRMVIVTRGLSDQEVNLFKDRHK